MPLQETVTIINNSGKIITTGKHLFAIFKDAKAAYQEKKAALKSERFGGIQRAQTFDVAPREPVYDDGVKYVDPYYEQYDHDPRYIEDRRYSQDDLERRSHGSSRSRRTHRSHRSNRGGSHHHHNARPALTESNLKTLSEVSATTASAPPVAYRSPYAETAPRDMALSRPTLARAPTAPAGAPTLYNNYPPSESMPISSPRQSMAVARPRSNPSLRERSKSIDLNLAYGNIPPDLASRVDLDPQHKELQHETEAKGLMSKIEGLLSEAQCLHHSASAIITNLQSNPERAAAVALTLAELSALLGKMSPAFLGVVKGGSPAIFALLASPQFLIGTGIAVGVTVVMFGGWKIIKRIKEAQEQQQGAKMAFEMQEQMPAPPPPGGPGFQQGAAFAGGPGSFDEAYILEEELSTIETWRRGIAPYGEDESADLELISPEAMRSRIEVSKSTRDGDAMSRRSERTHRTHRSHKTHKSRGHHSRRGSDDDDDDAHTVPERKSSKGFSTKNKEDRDAASVTSSHRSHRSHKSHRSSASKRTERVELKAIEDGSRQAEESSLDLVLRPKEKKNNMLKTLFKKKKEKEEHDRVKVGVSVLV